MKVSKNVFSVSVDEVKPTSLTYQRQGSILWSHNIHTFLHKTSSAGNARCAQCWCSKPWSAGGSLAGEVQPRPGHTGDMQMQRSSTILHQPLPFTVNLDLKVKSHRISGSHDQWIDSSPEWRGDPGGVSRAVPVLHGSGQGRSHLCLHYGHRKPAFRVPRVLVWTECRQRIGSCSGCLYGKWPPSKAPVALRLFHCLQKQLSSQICNWI